MKSRTWMWMTAVYLVAALVTIAHAEIVYTPVNVNLPTNGSYLIDLNHDGITDFTFQISHTVVVCGYDPTVHNILKVQPSPAGGIVGGSWSSALPDGVVVDFRQHFDGGDDLMYDVQTAAAHCPPPHRYGYWVDIQDHYLGLEFQINGQTHYGWAELSTDGRYGNGYSFLYGFAYETIPFKGILTGQTMDSPDQPAIDSDSAESTVPKLTVPVAPPFSNASQSQSPDAPGKGQIITFDAPGAGTGPGQGTFAIAINPAGAITGYYCDATNCHGFLRASDGIFTMFDAPDDLGGTYPAVDNGINPQGAITGYYSDAIGVDHGFLRARDGTITTIDPPGSITTFANAINPAGEITGSHFYAGDSGCHGFLRARDGSFTTFDAAGAGTCTASAAINPSGVIAGASFDLSGALHGFLRARDGTITLFDAPGACTGAGQGTAGIAINPSGAITAFYVDASNVYHGFLRARDGTITTFDAPGAGTGAFQGTLPYGINPEGAIAGYYVDASNVAHGFLRKKQ